MLIAAGTIGDAVGSMITQGIGVATGLQDKFSWAGIAGDAIGGGISNSMGRSLALRGAGYAGQGLTGVVSALASAGARSLIDGTSFGDNLIAALPGVIGSTIGNMLAGGVMGSGSRGVGEGGGLAEPVRIGSAADRYWQIQADGLFGAPSFSGQANLARSRSWSDYLGVETLVDWEPEIVVTATRTARNWLDRLVFNPMSLLGLGQSPAARQQTGRVGATPGSQGWRPVVTRVLQAHGAYSFSRQRAFLRQGVGIALGMGRMALDLGPVGMLNDTLGRVGLPNIPGGPSPYRTIGPIAEGIVRVGRYDQQLRAGQANLFTDVMNLSSSVSRGAAAQMSAAYRRDGMVGVAGLMGDYQGALEAEVLAAALPGGAAVRGGRTAQALGTMRGAAITESVPFGYTRAYRAVSHAEFDDIVSTGRFNQGPNSLEGKWFSDRYDDVVRHGNGLEGPGNYRIVEADLPNNAPSLYRVPNLDNRGPARFLHMDDLQGVTPRPYNPR